MSAPTKSTRRRGSRTARARRRAREAGIALVMVLGAIAVLTVMLAEFQDDTSAELASAMADRDSVQAEYMARSAVNLARLLIASEPTIRSSIAPLFMLMQRTPPQLPVWEFSDRLLGAFNDSEAAKDFAGTTGVDLSLGKNLGLPGGKWELVIVDEDSKIDANLGASNDIAHIRLAKELMGLMAAPIYDPLFSQKDPQGNISDRLTVCSSLIDWADPDDNLFSCDFSSNNAPSGQAKEDSYYQLLLKPYFRKNAPFDSLEELHMVRGISDDFWSTFVDPDPNNPKKRVVTVWGSGAVNVNTANPLTLLGLICSAAKPAPPAAAPSGSSATSLLPAPTATATTTAAPYTPAPGVNPNLPPICTDPNQTALFTMGLTMAKGITMGAPLWGSTKDFIATMKGQGMLGPLLTMLGVQPVAFTSETEFAKQITVESKMFSIYAVGVVKGYKRETRLSLHEVVDFRTAPVVSAAPSASSALGGLGVATAPSATVQAVASSSASVDPNTLAAAMQPSTGGQVVYFHVE
jgi:general secretion pathway protein K